MTKPFTRRIMLGVMAATLIAGGGGWLLSFRNASAADADGSTAQTSAVQTAPAKQGAMAQRDLLQQVRDQTISFLKLDKDTFNKKLASGETLAQIANGPRHIACRP